MKKEASIRDIKSLFLRPLGLFLTLSTVLAIVAGSVFAAAPYPGKPVGDGDALYFSSFR